MIPPARLLPPSRCCRGPSSVTRRHLLGDYQTSLELAGTCSLGWLRCRRQTGISVSVHQEVHPDTLCSCPSESSSLLVEQSRVRGPSCHKALQDKTSRRLHQLRQCRS